MPDTKSKTVKSSKKKAPRAPTPFILFRRDHTRELTEKNPGIKSPEINRICSEVWKDNLDVQQKYTELSNQIKIEIEISYENLSKMEETVKREQKRRISIKEHFSRRFDVFGTTPEMKEYNFQRAWRGFQSGNTKVTLGGENVDLFAFYRDVVKAGGFSRVTVMNAWEDIAVTHCSMLGVKSNRAILTQYAYFKHFYEFEQAYQVTTPLSGAVTTPNPAHKELLTGVPVVPVDVLLQNMKQHMKKPIQYRKTNFSGDCMYSTRRSSNVSDYERSGLNAIFTALISGEFHSIVWGVNEMLLMSYNQHKKLSFQSYPTFLNVILHLLQTMHTYEQKINSNGSLFRSASLQYWPVNDELPQKPRVDEISLSLLTVLFNLCDVESNAGEIIKHDNYVKFLMTMATRTECDKDLCMSRAEIASGVMCYVAASAELTRETIAADYSIWIEHCFTMKDGSVNAQQREYALDALISLSRNAMNRAFLSKRVSLNVFDEIIKGCFILEKASEKSVAQAEQNVLKNLNALFLVLTLSIPNRMRLAKDTKLVRRLVTLIMYESEYETGEVYFSESESEDYKEKRIAEIINSPAVEVEMRRVPTHTVAAEVLPRPLSSFEGNHVDKRRKVETNVAVSSSVSVVTALEVPDFNDADLEDLLCELETHTSDTLPKKIRRTAAAVLSLLLEMEGNYERFHGFEVDIFTACAKHYEVSYFLSQLLYVLPKAEYRSRYLEKLVAMKEGSLNKIITNNNGGSVEKR